MILIRMGLGEKEGNRERNRDRDRNRHKKIYNENKNKNKSRGIKQETNIRFDIEYTKRFLVHQFPVPSSSNATAEQSANCEND